MPLHDHDHLARFLLPAAGARGVRVHLDDTWRRIRGRAGYPAAIAEILGEAAAAAALFTAHGKMDGRLSVQLRSQGALRTVFAECTGAGVLRGIARYTDDVAISRDLRALGPQTTLAITIETPAIHGREPVRYQGLVAIESAALEDAFEGYFRQSEQLPTRLLLAADAHAAAGLMLQKLPGQDGDDAGWRRAMQSFDSVRPSELLELSADTLLHRSFAQEGYRILGEHALRFGCSCSRARVSAVLQALGEQEARAALIDGRVDVDCEFCGRRRSFDQAAIDALFVRPMPPLPAAARTQ